MYKISLKSIFAHKARNALMMLVIIISVSFISGTFIFSDSIRNTFNNLFDDVFSTIDVTVRSAEDDDFSNPRIDASLVDLVADIEGVRVLEPEISDVALLTDKSGEPIFAQAPTFGLSWTNEPSLNPLKISEDRGRAPSGPGEVVIDANTANQQEYALGDSIDVIIRSETISFTIVGIAGFGDTDSLAGATIAAFDLSTAAQLFDYDEQITTINVNAEDGISAEVLQQRIASALGEEVEVVTGDQQKNEVQEDINQGLGFITTFLLAFAFIAVFVSMFIIYNTFKVVVSQRTRELALLRSVGAKKSQVTRLVLMESLIVGVVASILGVLLGFVIAGAINLLAEQAGIDLPTGDSTIAVRTIVVSMLAGVSATVISSLLPARKASRVSIIEALTERSGEPKKRALLKRTAAGLSVLGVGIALLWSGLNVVDSNELQLVGLGALVMVLGIVLLAAVIAIPFMSALRPIVSGLFGRTGAIAVGNTRRAPRRTGLTASALMIGVAIVSLTAIFASSLRSTIDQVFADSFPADFIVLSAAQQTGPITEPFIEQELLTDIRAIEGVRYATAEKRTILDVVKNGEESGEFIIGVEPEFVDQALKLDPSSGSFEMLNETLSTYVNAAELESLGLAIGDDLVINNGFGDPVNLQIIDSFEEPYDSPFLLSIATFDQLTTQETFNSIFGGYDEGISVEEVRAELDAVVDQAPTVKIQSQEELIADIEAQLDQIVNLVTGLMLMAIIIALIGVAITLMLSIAERTREIGLLRAVGMTRGQVRATVWIEAVITSIFGALLGVSLGIFFAWAILKALEDEGFTGFSIPWIQLALYVVIAIVAAFIASLWPAWKASRTDVLEAINYQ